MYNKKGISSIAVAIVLTAIVVPITYLLIKRVHHKSPWQRSVEQRFAAKKSGQFEAKDKTGASVIFE